MLNLDILNGLFTDIIKDSKIYEMDEPIFKTSSSFEDFIEEQEAELDIYVAIDRQLKNNKYICLYDKLLEIKKKKGIKKDSELYKPSHVERQLYSKIKHGTIPEKQTIIKFIFGLQLNMTDSLELLASAGYILSPSIQFDVIIKELIRRKNYNTFDIDQVLLKFEEKVLFSKE